MIENDEQLQYFYERLARMYRLRDREAVEPLWSPGLREDVVAGTEAMIRKIEREVADYLATRAERAA